VAGYDRVQGARRARPIHVGIYAAAADPMGFFHLIDGKSVRITFDSIEAIVTGRWHICMRSGRSQGLILPFSITQKQFTFAALPVHPAGIVDQDREGRDFAAESGGGRARSEQAAGLRCPHG